MHIPYLRGRISTLDAELLAAVPLRPREVNVDGLNRSLVLSLGVFVTS